MSDLDANSRDRLVSAAKGVVGACPIIGPMASEAIGSIIPRQRLDRIVDFLRQLETEVYSIDERVERFERNLKTPPGLDILEEGLIQATRSVAEERKERLARLVGRSLSRKEIKYAESRKLLNLFRELTDPEILWLIFYSMNPTLGRGPHSDLKEKHPDVLEPVSATMGAPQEELDRAALQESYKNALFRLGLIEQDQRSNRITPLGELLVRYINDE